MAKKPNSAINRASETRQKPASGEVKTTPLMAQYYEMKRRYPDALMLFRVGDFYETFGEDAEEASRILQITLTKRSNGAASEVALAGFPYHALEAYLPKLVRAGKRVAICDQAEDPKQAKGLVKREVREVVTPGMALNDAILDSHRNNYLAGLYVGKKNWGGIAFLDISTGEFLVAEGSIDYLKKLFGLYAPAEVLCYREQKQAVLALVGRGSVLTRLDDWIFYEDYAREILQEQFGTNSLKGFGVEEYSEGLQASGAIVHYLRENGHEQARHIVRIQRIDDSSYVWLDAYTIRNLELVVANSTEGKSLLDIMDHTVSPMGGRMLLKWILRPLKHAKAVNQRLDGLGYFLHNADQAERFRACLKAMGDLERLTGKIASRRINPREMQQLKLALQQIALIKPLLSGSAVPLLEQLGDRLQPCSHLHKRLEECLLQDPSATVGKGDVMGYGLSEQLDELREILAHGKEMLKQIQVKEAERTGISSLKVKFNKVFGYYLEVTHAHKDKVPEDWIRKQTLVNAERYITEELKDFEQKTLRAEEQIAGLEQALYEELVAYAEGYLAVLQENAAVMAEVDILRGFAELAKTKGYHRPVVDEGLALSIVKGRHPVIEQELPAGEPYIPNDLHLSNQEYQISIISGPNMSGKSALLRQTALIALMAQMGSYVPAEQAHIGAIDRVFTRVGASDNLSQGESTFMVEMNETANILNNLTERSLIIMDEIGRGTGTYDGISIAWAIVEFIHAHEARPKTLFATHYHELNGLEEQLERVKAWHVAVKEAGDKIIFLRELREGGITHSFGIHVAQLAGVPRPVVMRAQEVMHELEAQGEGTQGMKVSPGKPDRLQLNLFEAPDPAWQKVKSALEDIDTNTISPIEALLKLNELKIEVRG